MNLRSRSCIFLFTVLLSAAVFSQSVVMDKVNTRDLTNPFVSSLFQDGKGYLWIGTIGGLNKYNGYNFTRYRFLQSDTTSLSNPAITSFHQNCSDTLYVGTRRGLNVYDYDTDKFTRVFYNEKLNDASLKNNISCIISIDGEVILGTSDGILLFDKKNSSLQTITHKNSKLLEGWNVTALCVDRLGNLWIAARPAKDGDAMNTLFRYSFASRRLAEVDIDNRSNHCGISEDYMGNIWIAADNGLINLNPGTGKHTFYQAPDNFYSNVSYTHAKDNMIWQCYWSFGISSFDIDKKEYSVYSNNPDQPKSLMSNKCWALLKDENDIMWIGSDVGLQKITSKRPGMDIVKKNNKNEKNSFRGNIINSVFASRKQNHIVFVGVDGEGFSIYNKQTRLAKNFGPNAENKNVERFANQFIEDEKGDVYVLGQNDFQKVTFSNGNTTVKGYFNFQEHYCASGLIDPIDSTKIWIGGRGEIMKFDKVTQKFDFIKQPFGITNVFYSTFVAGGKLYFGFRNGLLKIDPETKIQERIDLPNVGNISAALPLDKSEVLLASQFLGLIRFSTSNNEYGIIFGKNGEYFSEPSALLQYKNNIWLTGNGGLTAYNRGNGEVSELTTEDGLPSHVVHKIDLLDGYFYIGTHDGLAIMNPDYQVSHFIVPKIDVTKFQVLADNITYNNLKSGDAITLNERQNSFRINFTVLDFNLPEKNRYKFRLLPNEKDWRSPVGENFLIFNSLPAGKYRFELLGCNADQIWSIEPFVINIQIVPPFYKTSWFYPLTIILMLTFLALFFLYRMRSNRKKNEMLERVIHERTAEIQMQRAELLASITYARRIQNAIFEGEDELKIALPESFIYYNPKDKVSGDFYWIGKSKDMLIVFAGDCTGHGVPGAMLSIVGTSLMNKVVHEENLWMPGEILTRLNALFFQQLGLDNETARDGMDASVLCINLINHNVYYSGAKLDAVYFNGTELTEVKSHRISIGEKMNSEFKTQSIGAENSGKRMFYLFSDGIRDQHGGPDAKKLSMKRFKDILQEAVPMKAADQKEFVYSTIHQWKQGLPQTDDMILIGFRF
jgi:ligand-binding sensor domain-containing protein/serine phosphatase RsbU (regulator of sigma subunit)